MHFDHLHFLWLLIILPFLAIWSAQASRKFNQWLHLFARKKRPVGPQLFSILLLCCALGAAALALAEPRIQVARAQASRAAIEVAVGLDVSKSMLAEDITLPGAGARLFDLPNRLNRARLFVLDTLAELQGEKMALFIFASGGVEIVPFTGDYGYYNYTVKHINAANITVPGSDLGAAVQTGLAVLEASKEKGAKIMLLLSDGEDISPDKSSLYAFARQAADRGIRIYTVGVGGDQDALIPIRSSDGMSVADYYRDEAGSLLKTRMVRAPLQKIARMTGGNYYESGAHESARELVEAILRDSEMSGEIIRDQLTWLPLAPFFVMAALVFAIIQVFAVGYYQAVSS